MISRRKTREFLLQSLYSRHELGTSFERDAFIDAYFDRSDMSFLDLPYLDTLEHTLVSREKELIGYIMVLAPKFDLATIPVMHILILMIALTEILYVSELEIPEAVSLNEAIELAKRFSDDHGRMFINGALSTFLKEKDTIQPSPQEGDFRVF